MVVVMFLAIQLLSGMGMLTNSLSGQLVPSCAYIIMAISQMCIRDRTVEAALQEKILVIGENIKIRRFARFAGVCSAYVHGGGTHGVLVQFDTDDATAAKAEFTSFGKDSAMQIAAANPGYLCEAELPTSVIEKEKEILLAQISNDPKLAGKPEPVKVKICLLYTSRCV